MLESNITKTYNWYYNNQKNCRKKIGIDLDKCTKCIRAGVIPYTIVNKQMFFLFGIDNKTGELTDFGGGRKHYETPAQAAFRELKEESCELFGSSITMQDLENSPVIVNQKNTSAIFFCHINNYWLIDITLSFQKAQHKLNMQKHSNLAKYTELKGVIWINELTFKELIYTKNIPHIHKPIRLWPRIQYLLYKHIKWTFLSFILYKCNTNKYITNKYITNIHFSTNKYYINNKNYTNKNYIHKNYTNKNYNIIST